MLVLFFAIGVFSSAASFKELQRPEFALRHFIRFVLAKVAVGRGMEIMTAIFSICGSVVSASMNSIGGAVTTSASLPGEIVSAIEDVGFMQSIPLWLVSFLGSLFITVMSIILILTVYGRFFKLYLYTAISPLPFASFAGENTSGIGKAFVKSYMGVCLEGAVIVLALSEKFDDFLEWAVMYDEADIAAKKMIISRIIDRVDMHTGYDIKITLNISIEQFLNTIEMVA